MDNPESPMSSDSAHTPLQDEHITCEVTVNIENATNLEIGEAVDLIDEQLDYEEFVENNDEVKAQSEAEEGEYDSSDNKDDSLICIVDDKLSLKNGEILFDNEEMSDALKSTKSLIKTNSKENTDVEIVIPDDMRCDGELAEGELKAEEEDVIMEETPWERGLRLARERRELAKQKKFQEKDKLKERQLHINLDHIKEVEPISKPQIDKNYEVSHKLLKAMQPIVILPEEPRQNEMILEYYLAESDYQHRSRFIPSRLYTLDSWEVEEWKRELDMMKMESELERSRHKRINAVKSMKRSGRRGSVSSSGSSRSSSISGNRVSINQSNRAYEFQTSQYALSRNKPVIEKPEKPVIDNSMNKTHMHRGRRDLPPEFKNRIVSSSRSSSRSSSASHSSSSGSSSSTRSSRSSPARPAVKKRPTLPQSQKLTQPIYRTIKKPVLGRARSDSSASSKSSDSSSSSSDSSSSGSSATSGDSRKAAVKSKTDKQFINSWFTKAPENPLEAIVVSESNIASVNVNPVDSGVPNGSSHTTEHGCLVPPITGPENVDCELPNADSRPGVKLKLVSRPKPVILPSQTTSKPVQNKGPTQKDKIGKKPTDDVVTTTTIRPTLETSSIFQNSKAIFSTGPTTSSTTKTSTSTLSEIHPSAKESTLKSNLAATQLEMQQEFLRNYKDKIAIYRSQLSYQQQQQNPGIGGSGGTGAGLTHPSTLIHTQPPPIKGPITVMSVTSKKTGPPKTQIKVTDRYSQHEEHSRRHSNHQHQHYSPNYRNEFRDSHPTVNMNSSQNSWGFGGRNRNRSRSFDNDRDYEKSRDNDRGRNYFDKGPYRGGTLGGGGRGGSGDGFRPSRNSDYGDKYRESGGPGRGFRDSRDGGRDNRDDRFERTRNDHRNDYERGNNRFDRGGGDDRIRRDEQARNSRSGRDYNRSSNKDIVDQFPSRDDRAGGRADGEFDDRYGGSGAVDNYSSDGKQRRRHADHPYESSSSRTRTRHVDRSKERERTSGSEAVLTSGAVTVNHHHTGDESTNLVASVPQTTVPSSTVSTMTPQKQLIVTALPKEKRREELLKQLKAVEDAIAKKKAKIDK